MKTKQITFKIAILVAAFVVVSVAHAQTGGSWSNPTATPPGNNVSAPLHVGSETQTKAGGIGISGATGGLRIFDRLNTTESWQWYANKDTTTNKSWLRLWNHQDLRDQVTIDPTGMRLFGNLWSGGVVSESLQVTGGTPKAGKVLTATDDFGTVAWQELPKSGTCPDGSTIYTHNGTLGCLYSVTTPGSQDTSASYIQSNPSIHPVAGSSAIATSGDIVNGNYIAMCQTSTDVMINARRAGDGRNNGARPITVNRSSLSNIVGSSPLRASINVTGVGSTIGSTWTTTASQFNACQAWEGVDNDGYEGCSIQCFRGFPAGTTAGGSSSNVTAITANLVISAYTTIQSTGTNLTPYTVTVNGASVGDFATVAYPAGYSYDSTTAVCGPASATVSSSNTVKVHFWNNYSSNSCVVPNGTYKIFVFKAS